MAPLPPLAPGPGPIPDLTRAQIVEALKTERGQVRQVRGDHQGNDGVDKPKSLRPAAVLVPLIDRPDGITVLLTQRTAHLAAHAGQISFPGGRREPHDQSLLDAALRETDEEIGLKRERILPLGRLDTYVTRTAFRVEPWVGWISPPFDLVPDPNEVAEIFEVPLAFFLAEDQPQRHHRLFSGVERSYWVFPYGRYYIWGATAGMLRDLRERLLAHLHREAEG